ncbi:SF1B family DNA helicase RecD2 [Aerococcus sp. Group 1]|uniref:SF1B family DNA helicase RecD2 n=1 Tax=Aerococcus urinae (strain CCUG 59500 / ACS-120-V-Col10a) TaxID=2976812 RepID=UPI000200EBF0|nr:ATP-dependent RecD-like DNA helicase [Aerococcus sp. Group 1]AEA01235.1 helicase, RecD/TraA family [Aerococcus sp. Group 1]MCY3031681.1 ATP-dependent RecD-like DNA helicase [Aerococcus sp. Group 1]MCY3055189.1 ATP-dependent RecD-like DNA helicase [Aerococcus sp. Group 1]MCY3056919.1 ATP-dependent RecD-like DNA helicase [Aerococcus sp. Group 1]MCY3062415.1 ATP-dependent RecD-like DNA helicase [Aerococcus sp. Group 1]
MAATEDYFIGEVEATFFSNPDNYYRVMRITVDDTNTLYSEKNIVVTGNFGTIQDGTTYQFFGNLVDHPKYGVQFKVSHYEGIKITSKDGLIKYLSSDEFPGIGKILAERVVNTLGEKTIDLIVNQPERLKEVKGLTKNKQQMLHEKVKANRGNEDTFIQLSEMGFSNHLAGKIYAKYQDEAVELIKENPYFLVKNIQGFGFQKADLLAQRLDFAYDSPLRIQGAITFSLETICYSNGDTYVKKEELFHQVLNLLNKSQMNLQMVDMQQVADSLSDLVDTNEVIATEEGYFLPSLYYAEKGIVKRLKRIKNERTQPKYENDNLANEIEETEAKLGIQYGPAQRKAIIEALEEKLFILTGGPGTGKTTVLEGIIDIYCRLNNIRLGDYDPSDFPIRLAAPTGRAAKRMSETTGLVATTIHRLIGLTGEEDENNIITSDKETIEGDLLIIDEMSMVDTWLFFQLLEAVPDDMQIILVGDKDQLPSVGPGQVLSDLLRSQTITWRELDEIFRQDANSTITLLAHDIKNGQMPVDLTQNKADRSFFRVDYFHLADFIAAVAKRALEKDYDVKDIQVLAPMYKGQAGIDQINQKLQESLNPNTDGSKRQLSHFNRLFRLGDKVLQLQNHAEMNVFNGDMGEIVAIFFAKETTSQSDEIVVDFDGNEVTYNRQDFNQLTLAYCVSIHKSQGSEFPIVILPLISQYQRMLQRNLLYTAITRAKQSLILCGEVQAFQSAIQTQASQRHTNLYRSLLEEDELLPKLNSQPSEVSPSQDQSTRSQGDESGGQQGDLENSGMNVKVDWLTPALLESGQIDPLIGMDGISPYDF